MENNQLFQKRKPTQTSLLCFFKCITVQVTSPHILTELHVRKKMTKSSRNYSVLKKQNIILKEFLRY